MHADFLRGAARQGTHAQVGGQKDDCGGFEANRHPSSLQGHRLELRHILVDQLDIGAGDCRNSDLDYADCGLVVGDQGGTTTAFCGIPTDAP